MLNNNKKLKKKLLKTIPHGNVVVCVTFKDGSTWKRRYMWVDKKKYFVFLKNLHKISNSRKSKTFKIIF